MREADEGTQTMEPDKPDPINAHIMVDLETLGRGDDAVVTTIGYAIFNKDGIYDANEVVLSTPLQMSLGCTHDDDTLTWWTEQKAEARQQMSPSLTMNNKAHRDAVLYIYGRIRRANNARVWGNGPTFDLIKLRHQFKIMGLKILPWEFWNERCFRTALTLAPQVKRVRPTLAHSAKADAIAQAETLIAIHEALASSSSVCLLD